MVLAEEMRLAEGMARFGGEESEENRGGNSIVGIGDLKELFANKCKNDNIILEFEFIFINLWC